MTRRRNLDNVPIRDIAIAATRPSGAAARMLLLDGLEQVIIVQHAGWSHPRYAASLWTRKRNGDGELWNALLVDVVFAMTRRGALRRLGVFVGTPWWQPFDPLGLNNSESLPGVVRGPDGPGGRTEP